MSRWYRAYEGTVTDAKLGEVALVAECSRSVAIAVWHCILESAAKVNDGGVFDVTPRRIAVILGESPAMIERVMGEMVSLGMIAEGGVVAWSRRQFESDSSTERSRKRRERQKADAEATGNGDATAMQRCATAPETETETETEKVEGARARDPLPSAEVAEAVEAYNAAAKSAGWPACTQRNRRRDAKLKARIAEAGGLDGWKAAMTRATRSPFLRGETGRSSGHENWRPNLDFFLRPESFAKLIEGAYDGRSSAPVSIARPGGLHAAEAEKRANSWIRKGIWPASWGPGEGEPGCCIPPNQWSLFRQKEAA